MDPSDNCMRCRRRSDRINFWKKFLWDLLVVCFIIGVIASIIITIHCMFGVMGRAHKAQQKSDPIETKFYELRKAYVESSLNPPPMPHVCQKAHISMDVGVDGLWCTGCGHLQELREW